MLMRMKTLALWLGGAAAASVGLIFAVGIGVQAGLLEPRSVSAEQGPQLQTVRTSQEARTPAQAQATERQASLPTARVASAAASPSDLTPWPFKSESAVLRCRRLDGRLELLTVRIGDTEYALNGLAGAREYPDLEPVWLTDPLRQDGSRISINDAVSKASALCASGTWTREVRK